jgi:hypothetical protein
VSSAIEKNVDDFGIYDRTQTFSSKLQEIALVSGQQEKHCSLFSG